MKKMFLNTFVYVLRFSVVFREFGKLFQYSSDPWFFTRIDLILATRLAIWFQCIYICRTSVIKKFKLHWGNTLFNAVVYGQPIDFFKFLCPVMSPIIQIRMKSYFDKLLFYKSMFWNIVIDFNLFLTLIC